MATEITIDVPDLETTQALGNSLGPLLFPGAMIALIGPLGAGKTTFTRAVAEGLGVKNLAAVNSPTFTLIHEYAARLPIYHFDAYRLAKPAEFEGLGIEEYFGGTGVCLVEWADKFLELLPDERLEIRIERPSGLSKLICVGRAEALGGPTRWRTAELSGLADSARPTTELQYTACETERKWEVIGVGQRYEELVARWLEDRPAKK